MLACRFVQVDAFFVTDINHRVTAFPARVLHPFRGGEERETLLRGVFSVNCLLRRNTRGDRSEMKLLRGKFYRESRDINSRRLSPRRKLDFKDEMFLAAVCSSPSVFPSEKGSSGSRENYYSLKDCALRAPVSPLKLAMLMTEIRFGASAPHSHRPRARIHFAMHLMETSRVR